MKLCQKCTNYKPRKRTRWQKIWEVCYDFQDDDTGTLPIWLCLFIPIIAPLGYLVFYYSARKRVSEKEA